MQQTKSANDCYTTNLDNGNAALRRGEPNEALRFFGEAKNCPDVQGNTRRQAELDARIARCEEQMGLKKTSTGGTQAAGKPASAKQKRTFSSDVSNARGNFPAKHDFLKDTSDTCLQRMLGEADRAYRLHFWEDAAALYRAAKNCSDADQKARQQLSDKIIACRNAAENELFAKQQEAERQARHAIAANLADDAQELLRSTDRSLAFRLADFANQYIAPDDNPDCVQAMFDAWYYQPSEDELYGPAFCYELTGNLGDNTQLRFQQQKDSSQWLWAFVPTTGEMFTWKMPNMRREQSFGTGEGSGYVGFDFAPDGELFFWGDQFFELRRGSKSHRVDVPSVGNWCFSERGDEFFYRNTAEQKIYVLNVRAAFQVQDYRKDARSLSTLQQTLGTPREFVSGVPDTLLAMQYLGGKLWLGYSDRVEVLGNIGTGKPKQREKVYRFEGVVLPEFAEQKDLRLVMYPKEGFAVLGSNQFEGVDRATWLVHLESEGDSSKTREFENQYPLAIAPLAHQVACLYGDDFWVLDAHTGDTLLRQHKPSSASYDLMSGSFSPDARWVAAASEGDVYVWALQDAPTVHAAELPRLPEHKPVFSPDGSRLFLSFADTLAVFGTDARNAPQNFWKTQGGMLHGVSDHWALLQVSPDSAEARHLADKGRPLRFPLTNPDAKPFPYSFDSKGEKLVAYLSEGNRVEVRSLKTGALVANNFFEGEMVSRLQFVPNTDDLLVVQSTPEEESEMAPSRVKVWSPLLGENPRALRLHDYYVDVLAIDDTGSRTAFSNGRDIRIFDLQNLENEVLKIGQTQSEDVQAIAFRPNSTLLAAAYADGKVVFWDVRNGQASLQLQAVPSNGLAKGGVEIAAIAFSEGGTTLHIAVTDGRVLAYAIDPSYIRTKAQDENRQLQSFGPEHIVRYNLEAALYYPGNFERLAESGDAPLIRSFFQHFREQAEQSNNIGQVYDYCERTFYLYERLDENTQNIWQPDMRMMYEDYAWKLLLRGSLNEAATIIAFIKAKFDYDPKLLNAHLALLRRNFSAAAALYSSFILTTEDDGLPMHPDVQWVHEYVEKGLVQLRDYELLDSVQTNCFCGTVSLSGVFANFCPKGKNYPASFLSPADRSRWEIFEKRREANDTQSHSTKTKLLEEAHKISQNLSRQNPAVGQAWLETTLLELASAQKAWGVFERYSPEAQPHFDKAAQLLGGFGAFKKLSDTIRLSLLTSTQLTWGNRLLNAGKTADAMEHFKLGLLSAEKLIEHFKLGLLSAEKLIESVPDTSLLRTYYDELVGPLFQKIATAYLLEGKPAEARQAYEQANTYSITYGLNSLYLGNVALFENDTDNALLDYGGIFTADQTAEALFEIGRIIERFPEKRAALEAFVLRLKSGLKSKNPRLVNAEADFWLAQLKAETFEAQSRWDSAIVWSNAALQSAKRCAKLPNTEVDWTTNWLNEHINLPYYLLLGNWEKPEVLEDCIHYVKIAEDFLNEQDSSIFDYPYRGLLKTNLAHALVLRNQPGDRDQAIALYKYFLQTYASPEEYDNRDILEKDFRDLRRAGAPWPELPELGGTLNDER
ncbi:MAG: WD40 repeat domain-containing protein [Saprospiraceae bacterium]